jgi:hypothetical protein
MPVPETFLPEDDIHPLQVEDKAFLNRAFKS